MKLGGRIQATIEVLEDIMGQHTPATLALRDWGKAHRFAGSTDRSIIGNLVYDSLRQRSSYAWRMDSELPRALALAAARFSFGYNVKDLSSAFADDVHAPSPLTADEKAKLEGAIKLDDAPQWIQADVPEWLWPAFENNFGEEAVVEGKALSQRPPLDLRVNTLKSNREQALEPLSNYHAKPCRLSPVGIRIAAPDADKRLPNIQSDAAYQTGEVEIQDEGSQLVSLLVAAKAGENILDYCAGGGGKALALAADMNNSGQIYAFDVDKRRLAPLYQRAMRAGATMIDVRQPPASSLKDLQGRMDRVLIDAPCTGTGTWRRKPDAKWRLSEDALARRMGEQAQVLSAAKDYVRKGGLLFYVTCSMLAEENEAQVYAFLDDNPEFTLLSAGEVWEERFGTDGPKPWSADGCSLTLTPATTDTDGFFFAVMEKTAA